MIHIFRIAKHAGLALLLLFCLSGCEIKFAQLRALETLASAVQLTKGREVRRFTHNAGTTLGKPDYAEVLIVYEPIESYTKQQVYDEITALLVQNDWKRDELYAVPEAFAATYQQGDYEIDGLVVIFSDENLVSLDIIDYRHLAAGWATPSPTSPPALTPSPSAENLWLILGAKAFGPMETTHSALKTGVSCIHKNISKYAVRAKTI
jgi:hypothetical protein